jgi:hypothetical protein
MTGVNVLEPARLVPVVNIAIDLDGVSLFDIQFQRMWEPVVDLEGAGDGNESGKQHEALHCLLELLGENVFSSWANWV